MTDLSTIGPSNNSVNSTIELNTNSSTSKLWQNESNRNSFLNVKNQREEKAKQNYFYGKVNSDGFASDNVVGPVGSIIKINNELINMSRNIIEANVKLNSAKKKYEEVYNDFLKHYMGDSEEENLIYKDRLNEKLDALSNMYDELGALLYFVYKKFETVDNTPGNSFK